MSEKKLLSAADILDLNDEAFKDVDVPEWGGVIKLRALSAGDAGKFIEFASKKKDDSPLRLLVMSAVGEDGKFLFTEDHIAELAKKSLKVVMRLQHEALELNGLGATGNKIREALKNDSGEGPGVALPIASPSVSDTST